MTGKGYIIREDVKINSLTAASISNSQLHPIYIGKARHNCSILQDFAAAGIINCNLHFDVLPKNRRPRYRNVGKHYSP